MWITSDYIYPNRQTSIISLQFSWPVAIKKGATSAPPNRDEPTLDLNAVESGPAAEGSGTIHCEAQECNPSYKIYKMTYNMGQHNF